MFERYSEKSIKALMLAQAESRRLSWNFVGTEQLLLGLIGEGSGVAAKVLDSLGVNLGEARTEVEKIIGCGKHFVKEDVPFTPQAKLVLEAAWVEANQLQAKEVQPEHILLGIEWVGHKVGGVAWSVLKNLNADANIRTAVQKALAIRYSTDYPSFPWSEYRAPNDGLIDWDAVKNPLYPARCRFCDKNIRLDADICIHCYKDLHWKRCPICKRSTPINAPACACTSAKCRDT